MIGKIKSLEGNCLALELINGFTETDAALCQKWLDEKIAEGHVKVHVLLKLDELKVGKSQAKAFMEEGIWLLRHYKQIGHLAIVAHSKILKALVPIDNFFFERASKGSHERYFDVSQIEEAYDFIGCKPS